ncbi:MAG: hypothetical protein ACFCUJ_09920 [Thiotrichales bacterium]
MSLGRLMLIVAAGAILSACDQSVGNDPDQLPQPLALVEAIHPSLVTVCANVNGIQVVHGLDHDADGSLAPYERLTIEYLCHGTTTTVAAAEFERRVAQLRTDDSQLSNIVEQH